MKFSIIVPVYNVSPYVIKCLTSIYNQSYKNYEVIVVDDGSTDQSLSLINKYVRNKNKFKCYTKKNGGLSDARNYGLNYVTGDYILFVDSDDYISCDLLLNLNDICKKYNDDIIKYRLNVINDNLITEIENNYFVNESSYEALKIMLNDVYFEPAWLYAYKKSFWFDNKFMFEKGRLHEDFGLIPIIITKAKTISSINYIGYNYVNRSGSIVNSFSKEKELTKFNDYLFFYNKNINSIEDSSKRLLLNNFYANGIIYKARKMLFLSNKWIGIVNIRKMKIYNYLLKDSFRHNIKFFVVKYLTLLFVIFG